MTSTHISSSASSASNRKPKRPLTPYNLFYRYKRSKIVQASSTQSITKSAILKLVRAVPGLEDYSHSELKLFNPKDVYATSRDIVRQELQGNLLPSEGKRLHRKSHGAIEFVEMGRMMCDQWKLVDEPIKKIFKELAEEGKKLHRERYKTSSSIQDIKNNDSAAIVEKSDDVVSFQATYADVSPSSITPLVTIPTDEDSAYFSSSHCNPSSPRPTDVGKNNIITPIIIQPKPKITLNDYVQDLLVDQPSDEGDEFCRFIDSHIHLVDGAEHNVLVLGDYHHKTLDELIDMDECIDLLRTFV